MKTINLQGNYFIKILEVTTGEKKRFLNSKVQEIFVLLIQEPILKPRRVTKYFHILRANFTYQIKKAFYRIMSLAFSELSCYFQKNRRAVAVGTPVF